MAISLDGSLGDWKTAQRLDTPGTGVTGYELYATLAGDTYLFALAAPVPIGPETTLWLNTDRNDSTGASPFSGANTGAEFYINFFTDGKPYLYSGNQFGQVILGPLNSAFGAGNNTVEFSMPASAIGGALGGFDIKFDINNATSVPADFSLYKYSLNTTVGHIDSAPFGTVAHDGNSLGGQVYSLYHGLLGRAPDALGLEGWVAGLQHGMSARDIAQGFLNSAEGQARFGATDDAGFIEQMYQGNLGRGSDPVGLQSWLDFMKGGGTRAEVAVGFALSPEHISNLKSVFDAGLFVPDQDAANVARLYYSVLDRAPDAGGLQAWTQLVEQGTSLQEVARSFLASDEYEAHSTGLTDGQFVASMYQQILGRAGDDAGVQGWTSLLSQGVSRSAVSNAFTDSLEFQQKYQGQPNEVYAQALYEHVLGRSGGAGELAAWAQLIEGGSLTRETAAHAFTGSAEFQSKYISPTDSGFVEKLYLDALGRPADAAGLQGWTDALVHGANRADVAVSVAISLEAQLHWVSSIEQGWHLA